MNKKYCDNCFSCHNCKYFTNKPYEYPCPICCHGDGEDTDENKFEVKEPYTFCCYCGKPLTEKAKILYKKRLKKKKKIHKCLNCIDCVNCEYFFIKFLCFNCKTKKGKLKYFKPINFCSSCGKRLNKNKEI